MDKSFFVQCEKCDVKPATLKLTYGMQEKKLCFHCERELLKEPFYREWTKQFLSYGELSAAQRKSHKDLQISDSIDGKHFSSTQSRHVAKSPSMTTPHTNRIYQSIMEGTISGKSTESKIYKSPTSQLENLLRSKPIEKTSPRAGAERQIYVSERSGSRKKNRVFYSEYLKDLNPKPYERRSPSSRSVHRDISKGLRHDASSPFLSPKAEISESKIFDRTRSVAQIEAVSYTPEKDVVEGLKTNKFNKTTHFENKREQIRTRISQLAEKIYSPSKSPAKPVENRREYGVQENASRGSTHKDRLVSNLNSSKLNVSFKSPTGEISHPGVSDYSNHTSNVQMLKAHIDTLETRNTETVRQLKDELKLVKEELLKERTDNAARYNQEISYLNRKVNDLEKKLDDEASQNRLLKQEIQQTKTLYEEKLKIMKEELNRAREERDARINEISGQSKMQSRYHKDTLDQLHKDNEDFVTKLQSDNDFMIKDLNTQIIQKNQEIERLKRDREREQTQTLASSNDRSRLDNTDSFYDNSSRYQQQNLRGRNDDKLSYERKYADSSKSREVLMKKFDHLHSKYSSG